MNQEFAWYKNNLSRNQTEQNIESPKMHVNQKEYSNPDKPSQLNFLNQYEDGPRWKGNHYNRSGNSTAYRNRIDYRNHSGHEDQVRNGRWSADHRKLSSSVKNGHYANKNYRYNPWNTPKDVSSNLTYPSMNISASSSDYNSLEEPSTSPQYNSLYDEATNTIPASRDQRNMLEYQNRPNLTIINTKQHIPETVSSESELSVSSEQQSHSRSMDLVPPEPRQESTNPLLLWQQAPPPPAGSWLHQMEAYTNGQSTAQPNVEPHLLTQPGYVLSNSVMNNFSMQYPPTFNMPFDQGVQRNNVQIDLPPANYAYPPPPVQQSLPLSRNHEKMGTPSSQELPNSSMSEVDFAVEQPQVAPDDSFMEPDRSCSSLESATLHHTTERQQSILEMRRQREIRKQKEREKEKEKEKDEDKVIDLTNERNRSIEEFVAKSISIVAQLMQPVEPEQYLKALYDLKENLSDNMVYVKEKLKLVIYIHHVLQVVLDNFQLIEEYVIRYLNIMGEMFLVYFRAVHNFLIEEEVERDLELRDVNVEELARRTEYLLASCLFRRLDYILDCILKVPIDLTLELLVIYWNHIYSYFLHQAVYIPNEKDLHRIYLAWQAFNSGCWTVLLEEMKRGISAKHGKEEYFEKHNIHVRKLLEVIGKSRRHYWRDMIQEYIKQSHNDLSQTTGVTYIEHLSKGHPNELEFIFKMQDESIHPIKLVETQVSTNRSSRLLKRMNGELPGIENVRNQIVAFKTGLTSFPSTSWHIYAIDPYETQASLCGFPQRNKKILNTKPEETIEIEDSDDEEVVDNISSPLSISCEEIIQITAPCITINKTPIINNNTESVKPCQERYNIETVIASTVDLHIGNCNDPVTVVESSKPETIALNSDSQNDNTVEDIDKNNDIEAEARQVDVIAEVFKTPKDNLEEPSMNEELVASERQVDVIAEVFKSPKDNPSMNDELVASDKAVEAISTSVVQENLSNLPISAANIEITVEEKMLGKVSDLPFVTEEQDMSKQHGDTTMEKETVKPASASADDESALESGFKELTLASDSQTILGTFSDELGKENADESEKAETTNLQKDDNIYNIPKLESCSKIMEVQLNNKETELSNMEIDDIVEIDNGKETGSEEVLPATHKEDELSSIENEPEGIEQSLDNGDVLGGVHSDSCRTDNEGNYLNQKNSLGGFGFDLSAHKLVPVEKPSTPASLEIKSQKVPKTTIRRRKGKHRVKTRNQPPRNSSFKTKDTISQSCFDIKITYEPKFIKDASNQNDSIHVNNSQPTLNSNESHVNNVTSTKDFKMRLARLDSCSGDNYRIISEVETPSNLLPKDPTHEQINDQRIIEQNVPEINGDLEVPNEPTKPKDDVASDIKMASKLSPVTVQRVTPLFGTENRMETDSSNVDNTSNDRCFEKTQYQPSLNSECDDYESEVSLQSESPMPYEALDKLDVQQFFDDERKRQIKAESTKDVLTNFNDSFLSSTDFLTSVSKSIQDTAPEKRGPNIREPCLDELPAEQSSGDISNDKRDGTLLTSQPVSTCKDVYALFGKEVAESPEGSSDRPSNISNVSVAPATKVVFSNYSPQISGEHLSASALPPSDSSFDHVAPQQQGVERCSSKVATLSQSEVNNFYAVPTRTYPASYFEEKTEQIYATECRLSGEVKNYTLLQNASPDKIKTYAANSWISKKDDLPKTYKSKKIQKTDELFDNAIEGQIGKLRPNVEGVVPNMLWDDDEHIYKSKPESKPVTVKTNDQPRRNGDKSGLKEMRSNKCKTTEMESSRVPDTFDKKPLNKLVICIPSSERIPDHILEHYGKETVDLEKNKRIKLMQQAVQEQTEQMMANEKQVNQATSNIICLFKYGKHCKPKQNEMSAFEKLFNMNFKEGPGLRNRRNCTTDGGTPERKRTGSTRGADEDDDNVLNSPKKQKTGRTVTFADPVVNGYRSPPTPCSSEGSPSTSRGQTKSKRGRSRKTPVGRDYFDVTRPAATRRK